jgi:hypothetical protein
MSDSQDEPGDKGSPNQGSDNGEIIERCSCGYDRMHPMVTPKPTYTAWGTFWVTLMGVSSTPVRIDFICRRCDERFDFIVDKDELRRFL